MKESKSCDNFLHMKNPQGLRGGCLWLAQRCFVATTLMSIFLFVSAPIAYADFEIPPPPAPTMYATHAGAIVKDFAEGQTQTIEGTALNVVDTSWSIEANWINYGVPGERAVWAI